MRGVSIVRPIITRCVGTREIAQRQSTLSATSALAFKSHKSGQLEMAETLFRDVLAGYRELHGSDHPHTFDALDTPSRVQAHQGTMAAAECGAREAECGAPSSSARRTRRRSRGRRRSRRCSPPEYCEAGEIASEVVQRSKQLTATASRRSRSA